MTKQRRQEFYTGKVFIVLKNSADLDKIVVRPTDRNTLIDLCKIAFCCQKRETVGEGTSNKAAEDWYFERADEPYDIIWHNMGKET